MHGLANFKFTSQFTKKIQQDATVYQNFYFIFILSSKCFGRHTAHHEEPKTALAASGFANVGGCWACSCWTLSGRVLLDFLCELYNDAQIHEHQVRKVTVFFVPSMCRLVYSLYQQKCPLTSWEPAAGRQNPQQSHQQPSTHTHISVSTLLYTVRVRPPPHFVTVSQMPSTESPLILNSL